MTKTELVARIGSENTNIPAAYIDRVVKTMCSVIQKSDETVLRGFGTFRKTVSPARKGRNPKTGEIIDITEKTVLRFKASK